MAKIIAPNKDYSGVSATVTFINGIGYSNNEDLLDWFRSHGYQVEDGEKPEGFGKPQKLEKPAATGSETKTEPERDLNSFTVKELQGFAAANGIDLGKAKAKAEILAVILAAAKQSAPEAEAEAESAAKDEADSSSSAAGGEQTTDTAEGADQDDTAGRTED